jgi:hypothetical protein
MLLGKLQRDGFLALLYRKFGRWTFGVANRRSGPNNAASMGLVSASGWCRLRGDANGGFGSGGRR